MTYYPEHFRKTRPYIKEFLAELKRLQDAGSLNFKNAGDACRTAIMAHYPRMALDPTAADFDPRRFSAEAQAGLSYGEWVNQGSSIYDVHPTLTQAFKASALGEVSLDDVRFPFSATYVHFGPQSDLTLQTGACVTGAFLIYSQKHSLRVVLTAPMPDFTPWSERFAEQYDLRIPAAYFGMDVDTAIDYALAEDIADLKNAREVIAQQLMFRERGVAAVDRFLQAHEAHKETYRKCLQLIVNALCYLTAYPTDVQEVWQDGTPEKMRVKAESGEGKEAGRALSKLNAMGFRKVKRIGLEFDQAQEVASGHKAPHWRRGHWRNQPHGPQMALRRLAWIRPTRVMGAAFDDTPRVYDASPPEAQ